MTTDWGGSGSLVILGFAVFALVIAGSAVILGGDWVQRKIRTLFNRH
jgi:hypothetical protein